MSEKRATRKRGLGKGGAIVTILAIILYFYQTRFWETSVQRKADSSSFQAHGVGGPTEYDGVGGDVLLNRKKNRDTAPGDVEDLSVHEIIGLPSEALEPMGSRDRIRWTAEARQAADSMEKRGVRVAGYLVKVRESGPESCNGHIDSLRDYHLWITNDPDVDKREGLVAELTPRWKVRFPELRLRMLNKLAKQRAKVRITGWLMWDQEHPSEVGKSKGTCWEVHPITDFEVWSGGVWRRLSPGSELAAYSRP
jgi:hypothetical protein